jgi:hypothetical protein
MGLWIQGIRDYEMDLARKKKGAWQEQTGRKSNQKSDRAFAGRQAW